LSTIRKTKREDRDTDDKAVPNSILGKKTNTINRGSNNINNSHYSSNNKKDEKGIEENEEEESIKFKIKQNKKQQQTEAQKEEAKSKSHIELDLDSNPDSCPEEIMNISIVDDEKLTRQSQIYLIKKFLKSKHISCNIIECRDGIECLYKIYQGIEYGIKYDLIVTDETMNFMKGSYMAQIIKKLISANVIYDIKIFMVTSYKFENYADKLGIVFEKVYTKPISIHIVENIFSLC